ncbi:MAG: hypothetical protein U0521_06275 [Anaerolineae bacterium]
MILLRRRDAIRSQQRRDAAKSVRRRRPETHQSGGAGEPVGDAQPHSRAAFDGAVVETVTDTVISSASMTGDASAVAMYPFREDIAGLARSAGLSDQFRCARPIR